MVYVNNMKGIEFLLLAPEPCLNLHFTTNLFLSLSDFSLNIPRYMHYQVPVLTHKLFSRRECIAVLSRSKIYRQYLCFFSKFQCCKRCSFVALSKLQKPQYWILLIVIIYLWSKLLSKPQSFRFHGSETQFPY